MEDFLLPKGIVKNAEGLEASIESIAAQPVDVEDIARLWKVYTTTKRRLLDPTAERLENYWWRIWGSRRRELDASTVARIFAQISDGQSFVPLRGPANRDEGSPPLNRSTRHGSGATSATTIHRPSESTEGTAPSTAASKPPVPMPHPILKKTRGPSSTGPRPTARFISPHESDADTNGTTYSSNRSSSPNSHVVVQSPSPDSQTSKSDKKAANLGPPKKKGRTVAPITTKRRPMMTRRQSSQSSTDSVVKMEGRTEKESSADDLPSTLSEPPQRKGKASSGLRENLSPNRLATPPSKRKPSSRSLEHDLSKQQNLKANEEARSPVLVAHGEPGPSNYLRSNSNQQLLDVDISDDELELQQSLLLAANAARRSQMVSGQGEDMRGLGTSFDGTEDQESSGIRLKSAPSLASTLTDASGQLELGESMEPFRQVTGVGERNKGKGKESDGMFAKRPVPPASESAAASAPEASLAKSKSQLTFLLQKDRAKSGGQPAEGKKRERKK